MFLVAALPSQTFVVDIANGSGTNYTSIAAAVAAVPSGATLIVRPGTYAGFSIQGKGLTIVGETGNAGDSDFRAAQAAGASKKEFRGNVSFVKTRAFLREPKD